MALARENTRPDNNNARRLAQPTRIVEVIVALDFAFVNCAPGAIRTRDTRFRRAVLYPLSYRRFTRIEPTEWRLPGNTRLENQAVQPASPLRVDVLANRVVVDVGELSHRCLVQHRQVTHSGVGARLVRRARTRNRGGDA